MKNEDTKNIRRIKLYKDFVTIKSQILNPRWIHRLYLFTQKEGYFTRDDVGLHFGNVGSKKAEEFINYYIRIGIFEFIKGFNTPFRLKFTKKYERYLNIKSHRRFDK